MVRLARMAWLTGLGVLCLSRFAGAGEIHDAIRAGDLDRVKAVVAADPTTIEQPDTDTSLPLQVAVGSGHTAIVEWLVTHGATLEWKSPAQDYSALQLAAIAGYVDVVRVLAIHGAAVDARSRVRIDGKTVEDVTPLHEAAMLGHEGVVSELLARGASVNARTNEGYTALHAAARKISRDEVEAGLRGFGPQGAALVVAAQGLLRRPQFFGTGHRAICALLATHGADVNARNNDGWTPLGIAAAGSHLDVLTCLLDHGADVHRMDNSGFTPLHSAAERGRADVTRALLAHGAFVDRAVLDGRTALHIAAQNGDRATIEALLDAKADVNVRHHRTGWTPLHAAVVMGHPAATAALLGRGARVDARDDDGGTALHFLASWRRDSLTRWPLSVGTDDEYRQTIRLLVGAGADVNARATTGGGTPLGIAARVGDWPVVETLLALGADTSVRDPDGFTLFHQAADHGQVAMLELLLTRDARSPTLINARVKDGRTPLHLAAQAAFPTPQSGSPAPDYPRVIELLLAAGADRTARASGETPLDLAVRLGRRDEARVLRQAPSQGIPRPPLTPIVTWEQHMEAGNRALAAGRAGDAETSWRAALDDAERLGPDDPHLLPPLDRLGNFYRTQGRTAEAEPLLRRALAVRERLLGADHLDVASSLESYAAVLRSLGRAMEAEPLEARARTIRAKPQ